jgi:hypothetical protein
MAASLCSGGWHESLGTMMLVVVGYLYMSEIAYCCVLSSLEIVMSRNVILLSVSFSMVNCSVGIMLLKQSRKSCVLVRLCLYTIRISSTFTME